MSIKIVLKMSLNRLMRKSNEKVAREVGVTVGERCRILTNPYTSFGSEPYLVEMGNHVEIANGCSFITHDGAVWTLRDKEKFKNVDKFGKITIGNNVFIGTRSTIMPGVTIGDNCIIGACSLVTKSVPSGEVWAGVPAKKICTLDEYEEKVLKNCDYTKGLSPKEKEKTIRESHPEWFERK